MKKSILLLLSVCVFSLNPVNCQVGRLLNKVTKSVANDVIGKPDSDSNSKNVEPEPKCACEQPELVVDLGGKLNLMYTELNISVRDDGAILLKERYINNYYIVKDGVPEGPIKAGDPRLAGFTDVDAADAPELKNRWANNEYISTSGGKYTIKFDGKSYGPYGEISEFKVTKSKSKFAAIVTENIPVTAAEGDKMDAAIKNAKTEEEKRELAMKYSQQMMAKMQQGGGPNSMLPKLVTNIEGVTYDPLKSRGGSLNNNTKYDDILFTTRDQVFDLSNNVLLTLKPDAADAEYLFVNTANTGYAYYKYGTLTFSEDKTMSELFNPHLVKADNQVNLAYMYYSPKKNAILQCKIPF